ncbi:MAG: hypothetical protein JRF63_05765 [Deltaproteobacteria bacterium]|nr:hypothetical protein [Deltaproteobacteria bacterium]
MKKLVGNAFVWFVPLLLVLELVAWYALPYSRHPRASEVERNPTDHRAWPEYLRAGDENSGKLIVLLSASQAVGKEIEDPQLIYPALIRRELERRDSELRLENWATGGTRTVDIELLSMKAVQRGADLVVLGFSFRNFDRKDKLDLDYPFTDVNLFAGDPRFFGELEDTTFAGVTEAEDVLQRSAKLGSSLARSRVAVIDAIVERTPLSWHRWVVGRFVRPRPRLDDARDPAGSLFWADQADALAEWQVIEDRRRLLRKRHGVRVSKGELAERLETFRVFHEALTRRFERSGTRSVWVWLPMKTSLLPSESLKNVRWFYSETTEIVEATGVRCHDLHDAIPSERFLTPGHVDEPGHELLAESMLELIGFELEGPR